MFVAVYQRDFLRRVVADRMAIDAYTASGTHHSIAANRISYIFDLRGPSLVVDTACSSSLVALHLACRSLLAGECDRAIVGGVNLMLSPEETMSLSRWGMLAGDGRCKTFDSSADGFVRGEGCVALVLERPGSGGDATVGGMRTATARALVRGTAVNQDGRSNGLTAPNGGAQIAVIREAVADAGIDPAAVGFVETHGTGTSLGDPIEVEALSAVYTARGEHPPRPLGAVKTNVGHLEAAAGLTGALKAILAVEKAEIPPNLHFEQLNPAIDLDPEAFAIPTALRPWTGDEERVAAVSSFGMGGTNAHVLVQQAPVVAPPETVAAGVPLVVPIAGAGTAALSEQARAVATRASEASPAEFADLAAGLALRRSHLDHRAAVVASTGPELSERLIDWLDQGGEQVATGRRTPQRVVFVFPGQGSQWRGMACRLLETEPVFREAMERCDLAVRDLAGWSVVEELRGALESSRFDRIATVQPLIFSVQVALAALWRSWGVEPDAVVGHSMGEVAAAHVAGALSLEDAATVLVRRCNLMAKLGGQGAMLAVELTPEEAVVAASEAGPDVSLAVVNGPTACVLSGPADVIAATATSLEARGVRCREIAVDVASHSPAVDPLRDALLDAISDIEPRRATLPLYSTVTGSPMHGDELEPGYWYRNLRDPVRFWEAVVQTVDDGHTAFVELSTHPILLPAITAGLDRLPAPVLRLPSGRRNGDDRVEMLSSLATFFANGGSVRWQALHGDAPHVSGGSLPGYPFQRDRFPVPEPSDLTGADGPNPLLGRGVDLAEPAGARVWNADLDTARAPFLADHTVEGVAIVPGTGAVEMLLAAGTDFFGDAVEVRDARFLSPIPVPSDEPRRVQVILTPEGPGRARAVIAGRDGDAWNRHVTATVALVSRPSESSDSEPPVSAPPASAGPGEAGADFYARLAAAGNTWGPSFHGVQRLWAGADEAIAEISVPDAIAGELHRYTFHPAVLDACGQALSSAVSTALPADGPFVMASLDCARTHTALAGEGSVALRAHVRVVDSGHPAEIAGDVDVFDTSGALVAELRGLRIRFLEACGARGARDLRDWLHRVEWRPVAVPNEHTAEIRAWTVRSDDAPLAQALAGELRAAGADCVVESLAGPAANDTGGGGVVILAVGPPDSGGGAAEGNLVSLAGVDTKGAESAAIAACSAALDAFGRAKSGTRVWLVTRGAAPVLSRCIDPARSALWGLGRALEAERPAAFGALVDLDPDQSTAAAASTLADLLRRQRGPEPQFASRDGVWVAPRLVRLRNPSDSAGGWRPDPSTAVLVTGGLGALGLAVARRLVDRGARHLVLAGRTPPPDRAEWADLAGGHPVVDAIVALEALGAHVYFASLDIGDPAAVDAFAARWRKEHRPPVRSVVHAAGVQAPAPADETSVADLRRDLRPKLAGAWNIAAAWPDIERWVFYSSAASVLGSPLLTAYAAANAVLDGLAGHLREQGVAATAISWGAWGAGGMATRYEAERRSFTDTGLGTMAPGAALDALELSLASGLPHAVVMSIDWSVWAERHPESARVPLLTDLVTDAAADASSAPADGEATEIAALEPAARRAALETWFRRALGAVLRLSPTAVDLDVAATRLGLDSLMAVELRNRIASQLDLTIPLVEILRADDGNTLVDRLDSTLAEREDEAAEEEMEVFRI